MGAGRPRRAIRRLAALTGAAVLLAGSAGAEDAVPEGKRALIAELLEISGIALSTDAMAHAFLAQLEPDFGAMVDEVLAEETQLDADERRSLREELADFARFSSLFRARFAERIDVAALFESVYVPLYARYFEESELREIVAFYRSPTGRKTLAVMPDLARQGLAESLALLRPRVIALVGEVLAEERARLLR